MWCVFVWFRSNQQFKNINKKKCERKYFGLNCFGNGSLSLAKIHLISEYLLNLWTYECVCVLKLLTRNGTPNLIETSMQTIHWDWCRELRVTVVVAAVVAAATAASGLIPYGNQTLFLLSFLAYYVLSYSFFCLRHLCFCMVRLLVRTYIISCIPVQFSRNVRVRTANAVTISLCLSPPRYTLLLCA